MTLGFFFDSSRCTGCRTCTMACADYNNLPTGHRYRRVIDFEGGTTTLDSNGCVATDAWAYHISLACNHCANPACVHVCPTGAMHKDDQGLVSVNTQRCVGCGYCTIACPYHEPSINPELKQSSKCHGCSERLSQGKNPICVDACPLRALDFGEIRELREKHPDCVATILPLPEDSYTSPNLLIKPNRASELAMSSQGHISDEQAIANNYASSQGEDR